MTADYITQRIINKVIDTGFYQPKQTAYVSWHICTAAHHAWILGYISEKEYDFLIEEIDYYILLNSTKNIRTLAGMLTCMHLPNTFEDRLHIYKNWKDRPGLHRKPNKFVEFLKKIFK